MYAALKSVIDSLAPTGHEARVLPPGVSAGHPDLSIIASRSGGLVAHIEVKHANTIDDVFEINARTGRSQAQRYRDDGVPVWLTDAVNWWDISEADNTSRQVTTFRDDDAVSDETSEAQLKAGLFAICGVRPRFGRNSATAAIGGVIARINSVEDADLDAGWAVVRDALGLADGDDLEASGAGEIVAFTLLAIASELPEILSRRFVDTASEEWESDAQRWALGDLPTTMAGTLRLFRDQDRVAGGALLGVHGWLTVRAIAAWINGDSTPGSRWERLSDLWDSYLHVTGRRKDLGSWQTHRAIADLQAGEVGDMLQSLGYAGLADPSVTVLDPCCGTGVYLDAVVSCAAAEGAAPESFNATEQNYQRLIGFDISPTAVAATHIRMTASGARPALHMTDTLATGATSIVVELFSTTRGLGANQIVAAARSDHAEANRWASRSPDRDPVLAIIGNPPYQRSGMDGERYTDLGWKSEVFNSWRAGSGGRGSLQDPFVAFWAWALNVCTQRHEEIPDEEQDARLFAERGQPYGIVSFITNRSWLVGDTFKPMRGYLASRVTQVSIHDFGPGSRGNAASVWSEQPFAIETGTAIVTLLLDPSASAAEEIRYRRCIWKDRAVSVTDEYHVSISTTTSGGRSSYVVCEPWVPTERARVLVDDSLRLNGIKTGMDDRWISCSGSRDLSVRHHYRPFDNRWSPHTTPTKVARTPRGEPPIEPGLGETRASADWRRKTIFEPHAAFIRNGGWYLIAQSKSAKPGPGLHATRCLPDYHAFKGSEGGRIVRVSPSTRIPADYRDWAEAHGVGAEKFWRYVLAAANHPDYWAPGTEFAQQLAEARVAPPLTDDEATVDRLAQIGSKLVDLWSLDGIDPVPHRRDAENRWSFERETEAGALVIHGRPVLERWLRDRPDRQGWDSRLAAEYGRSIAALLEVRRFANDVEAALR